jgi:hypothetical protein
MRAILAAALAAAVGLTTAVAQTRFTYSSGQDLSPSYEGWMPNDDGSADLYFGYMNSNWLQEFDIPVGADNSFSPGPVDRGQPTHFYPRRNPFLFTVRVPKEFGSQELVWTLAANGHSEKAYASLKSDYLIDKQVISTEVGGDFGSLADALRDNIPPTLKVDGAAERTVKVGQPLALAAVATDPDNIPKRRDRPVPATAAAIYRPPSAIVPQSGPGIRFSWIVYRGPASHVTFSPDQMKTWTDTRAYANSPWSPPYTIPAPPPGDRWEATATFDQPGTYVLRGVASDGSIFTYQNVTVTVTP